MVVVGDGPVRAKLERRWPDVHFAGMRYDEDLARHYASADIFIFGSTSETFGNVVIEAMASGLAVLTYNYAAGKQFIHSGQNGYLVPLGDRQAFIKCTQEILNPESKIQSLRKAARATAEGYPWSNTIDRFSKLLQNVVETEQNVRPIDIVPKIVESLR
jgi:glycosyltransferase involved in cell wall biosynthesis